MHLCGGRSKNPTPLFSQPTDLAFRFLRQPTKPSVRPPANCGSAPSNGGDIPCADVPGSTYSTYSTGGWTVLVQVVNFIGMVRQEISISVEYLAKLRTELEISQATIDDTWLIIRWVDKILNHRVTASRENPNRRNDVEHLDLGKAPARHQAS